MKCAGGLTGGTIHIAGLSATMTDVLVRLERLDGTTQVTRLTPSAPSFVVEAAPAAMQVAPHLSETRRRAHSGGHRPSAVRPRAADSGERHAPAHRDRHGVHRRAQPHARGRDARIRARAGAARRSRHRAEHRVRGGGDRAQPAGQAGTDGEISVGRRVHLRPAARLRLRQRAERSRPAAIGDSRRAASSSTSASSSDNCCSSRPSSPSSRSRGRSRVASGVAARMGLARSSVRHRQRRGVLGHPAHRFLFLNPRLRSGRGDLLRTVSGRFGADFVENSESQCT